MNHETHTNKRKTRQMRTIDVTMGRGNRQKGKQFPSRTKEGIRKKMQWKSAFLELWLFQEGGPGRNWAWSLHNMAGQQAFFLSLHEP